MRITTPISTPVAYLEKRGNKWRAHVHVNNERRTKTFATKREAVAWSNAQEEDGITARHTLLEATLRYQPIAESHRGGKSELSRLKSLQATRMAALPMDAVTPEVVAKWRDARLKQVAPVSVRREMIILGALWQLAIKEWQWARVNPIRSVARPSASKPRQRGIIQDEIEAILAKLHQMRIGPQVAVMFEMSIETGMRLSELCSITWDRVHEKHIHLDKTKNGDERDVPLSMRARELVELRRGIDEDALFSITPMLASKTFQRAAVNGVHFHDARSEAITRLSKKLDVMQLAKMIGHRDLKSLMIYYAEKPADIADKL